jgi:hydroxyethylthiazole kinase-like uncharacterized protein yjeF
MHVLQVDELRTVDHTTLRMEGISSMQLMERAASRILAALLKDYPLEIYPFAVLCGPGNNGGDGLVIARLLKAQGARCKVYLLEANKYSEENLRNQALLEGILPFNPESKLNLSRETVIIDALYGFGLKQHLSPIWSTFIHELSHYTVLSVDMPSGLFADQTTTGPVFPSTKVYTIHSPKLAFFVPENKIEAWEIIDIDLQAPGSAAFYFTDEALARTYLKWPSRFSHKGTFGHAYLLGGSEGMYGALQLSAKAALRGGCGLVSVYGPSTISDFPAEVMVHKDPHTQYITTAPSIPKKVTAIGVGMGLGPHTAEFMSHFLKQTPGLPMVLDADALNHIARQGLKVPKGCILTPHIKEFERLCGRHTTTFERWSSAEKYAAKTGAVLILKGANTCIFLPDGRRFYNSTGNYGMAKGGAGDVLTGIITALLAQGYNTEAAAILGVYLHGSAGDHAANALGPDAMCASDLITFLPAAWKSLRGRNTKVPSKQV